MTRIILALFLAAGLTGAVIGIAAPARERAHAQGLSYSALLLINPGSVSTRLTCGWHGQSVLFNYQGNHALDFGNFAGQPVHWRSWGYRSDFIDGKIASAVVNTNNAGCYQITVDKVDILARYLGTTLYVHTAIYPGAEGATWDIEGGPSQYKATTRTNIGVTRSLPDLPNCPIDAPHLHQYSSIPAGYYPTRNTGYYPDAPLERDISPGAIESWIYDMRWTIFPF